MELEMATIIVQYETGGYVEEDMNGDSCHALSKVEGNEYTFGCAGLS